MDSILEQFLTESRENLSFLDENLKNLNSSDEELVNALFRAAHTLKGGAGLVGLESVKEVTHAAEDLLDAYRKGKIKYSDELVDILYDAFDEVVGLIDALEEVGNVDDVEFNEEEINKIKNEVRSFLEEDKENKEETTELPFVVEKFSITDFSFLQLRDIFPQVPLKVKIDNDFLETSHLWFVEMDLDENILELGNDPIYLFSLLEKENLIKTAIKTRCGDYHKWNTYILAVINSDAFLIEDVFYNILDEMRFLPVSIENIFDVDLPNLEDTSLIEDFKNEIVEIYAEDKFEFLDEKLNAINQILSKDTKEGFILEALQMALQVRNDKKEILKIAFEKLGWEIKEYNKKDTKNNNVEKKEKENLLSIDDKSRENALNILKTQLEILKKDENAFVRTKLLLSNVLGFLDLDEGLASIEDKDELIDFIKNKIALLSGNEEEKIEEKKEIKIGDKENKKIKEEKKEKTQSKKTTLLKTVKIEQSQIDELMDITGEMLVVKNALPYIASKLNETNIEISKREILEKYEQITRIVDRLQDRVMGMRLLPLTYIFDRYPRLVRELSKKLNKKINYIEEGKETKLDKTVIEKLADPMIHLIRNSIDHGIESPEERVEKGKPAEGTIKISARNEGDKVYITIQDDGRGIDEQKVIKKALEKRLINPDLIDKMSKEEKLKLIFLPGLSTKEQITDLSGRGVGMDAVKSTIEELGGKISIQSQIDKGTKITIELPLSVALTTVFHIKMNGVNYAIPMDYVVETEKINKKDIQILYHKPFVKIRDELIPVLIEDNLLDEKTEEEVSLLIIKGEYKFALMLDELIGQLDVVQKPLDGILHNHPFITGTSMLGNGEVLFIIDPRRLVKE